MNATLENNKKICIGVITSASGVKGKVKIRSFTEKVDDIANFSHIVDQDDAILKIKVLSAKKDHIIAGIDGITSRNEAERLRNTKLYINRNDLPGLANDEYYHADLIGLEVRNTNGLSVGVVRNVLNYGAGDVIEVSDLLNGSINYYPFTLDFIPEINVEIGYLVISPVEEIMASQQLAEEEL